MIFTLSFFTSHFPFSLSMIQVGTIQKAYGKGGELVVRLWDNFPENPKDIYGEPLWVEMDSLATPLFVGSLQSLGTSKAVVVFDDFESEQRAAMLIGKKLYSKNPQQPQEQTQDDWDFLVGYKFMDTTSGVKGEITDFIGNELNPLMEVTTGGEAYFVPVADELVEHLDERRRTITMNLPEGIFDINEQ